jgi:hypothetical protein
MSCWVIRRDLLHLVDILCCCSILFPIVWSINHLRLAVETDGKMSANLQKLQLFRKFYIMVIVYVYCTRIVVFLISASMNYQHLWLGDFSTELVTFIFYISTGYQFRPMSNNPYLSLRGDDGDVANKIDLETNEFLNPGSLPENKHEFGLADDDDEDESKRKRSQAGGEFRSSGKIELSSKP